MTRVIGLAGWSGAGKTTLIGKLIPHFVARGFTVSTLKHAHHQFDVDQPGKDSFIHRAAGAREVLVSSGRRWALMHELQDAPEPDLAALLAAMSPVDLILVEGFKREKHPKIEVFRAENAKPPLHPGNETIVAVAADITFPAAMVPVTGLNDIAAIATLALASAEPLDQLLPRLMQAQASDGPTHG